MIRWSSTPWNVNSSNDADKVHTDIDVSCSIFLNEEIQPNLMSSSFTSKWKRVPVKKPMAVQLLINLLNPTGYVMHQQVKHSTTVCSAHTVFMCFVFIWERTATSASFNITDWFL